MGSLGGDLAKKAMWLFPKISGFIPPERWGHSACFSHGLVYVYGGCCGGLHFSEVLVLNLNTMSWSILTTKGKNPGPRDSHSVALWGRKMVVFGGTNGSKKLNDLFILDLVSYEWTQPLCIGNAPCPRESHTSTLVGVDKLVIFGGSGQGIGNYLNDLHVLDLKSMTWSSTDDYSKPKGESPSPRDSHAAAAVGDELFVFGGDSGDRYHGEAHKFDIKTMTWMKLAVEGSSPVARAGHAIVSIGHKIYVVGGVGDKTYYDDAWCLDTETSSWSKLEICGPSPQGRFSHSAIVAGSDIVIYGGCGEDERPLREVIVLHLRNHSPNEWHTISTSEGIGNHHWIRDKRRSSQRYKNLKAMFLGKVIQLEPPSKRRSTANNTKTFDIKQTETEDHVISVSQHSSPAQSDQEQTTVIPPPMSLFNPISQSHTSAEKPDCFRHPIYLPIAEERPAIQERPHSSMIGAEVQGKVDGAFDSGYLMTAYINGRVFRGVLFAPVPGVMHRRGGALALHQSQTPMKNAVDLSEEGSGLCPSRHILQPLKMTASDSSELAEMGKPPSTKGEAMTSGPGGLDGVVLSLGVPGNGR